MALDPHKSPLDDPAIAAAIESADKTNRYSVAVWYVENGTLFFRFMAQNFPIGDCDDAIRMIRESFGKLVLDNQTRKVSNAPESSTGD